MVFENIAFQIGQQTDKYGFPALVSNKGPQTFAAKYKMSV